ncbi:MAG: HIG1 domain-containing protein [Sphingorhabdus sp.]
MGPLLIIALLIVMGLVVWAVVRGLHAFANMDPNDVDEHGVPRSLVRQNQMMFARVKWQAIAVAIVTIIVVGGAFAS